MVEVVERARGRFGRRRRPFLRRLLLLVGAALAFAPAASAQEWLSVLSSRPDTVSGGDALLAVSVPEGVRPTDVRITVGGADVTAGFRPAGKAMIGLVSGLRPGKNAVSAQAGGRRSSLTLVNHSRNGPMFSGPHQTPFICETDQFKLPDNSTLGPPQDTDCNAPTRVMYLYRPTSGSGFKVLPPGSTLPSDMRTTTTLDGRTVNYIVRLETGTINRAIYQIAVLFDPTKDELPSPTASYNGWNGRAVLVFGGGATAGYHQGAWVGDEFLDDDKLSRGFAMLSSTLNVFAIAGSDVLSAETASMLKEHFIEEFGPPRYLMGWGGSGGSMQQHLIANNYPGILDGIVPGASFPDLFSLADYPEDCALMKRVFAAGKQAWTDEQKRAASGLNTWASCDLWTRIFTPAWMLARQADPPFPGFKDSNCNPVVPRRLTYDRVQNPSGARCDLFSASRNQLGFDPNTGKTYRAYDNVGVQYGLKAFLAGAISAEQFVELNERIGGIDDDGEFQPARSVASPIALRRMFESGRINQGGNLAGIPMIDIRGNPNLGPEVHDPINSEVMRARLLRSNGQARNHVMVRAEAAPPTAPGSGQASAVARLNLSATLAMDRWLSNIAQDRRAHPSPAAKVVANRPADLPTDVCLMADGSRIDEESDVHNRGTCARRLPYFEEPRLTAGEPLTRDILKCHLRPLRPADYPGLSPAQVTRLKIVFQTGVCDYSRPSVGFAPLKGTWLSYETPGKGVPMGRQD